MEYVRRAGVLLHPTSLPGKYGIGDLGDNAFQFVDFLAESGQTIWQVFPLGPTGYGDSPYQALSAFAGNPLLISPDLLLNDGFITQEELDGIPPSNPVTIDYGSVIEMKTGLLKKAYLRFKENDDKKIGKAFDAFIDENKEWLEDYVLFRACKDYFGGKHWAEWEDKDISRYKKSAIKKYSKELHDECNYHRFVQFAFFSQWNALRKYANRKGIKIIGDLPLFVAYDSSDVWANKELFTVKRDGTLKTVAGVPPDYFSETGQLWGNPLYRWKRMEKDDFQWWRNRVSSLLKLVDIVRIDHFRGLEAFWEIPGDAETAVNGKWVKAPGDKLLKSIKKHLGKLPIIAEDLGVITPPVIKLRDSHNLYGITILQFAFGKGMEKRFLPHNLNRNCVIHTGSHDNDTTRGFYEKARNEDNDLYEATQKYLNYYEDDITSELIRTAFASVAAFAIIPMQDILNLGSEARMNFPGTLGGNWCWRFTWEQIPDDLKKKYHDMAVVYERLPEEKKTKKHKSDKAKN